MNKVLLTGRLTQDITVNEYGKGDNAGILTGFGVAVQGQNKDYVVFVNCTAFNGQAEFLAKWFKKGSPVEIEGRLQNDNYTDIEGGKHYTYKVVVERVSFLPTNKPEEDSKPAAKTTKYRR